MPRPSALLDTLAEQAAAALDRASLAAEMRDDAHCGPRPSGVRNTLLASISHDFRTPLAIILGAATSLLEYGDRMDARSRDDLLDRSRRRRAGSTTWCAISSP